MSESPNKLIMFWQELKRRKVFGVVTTYTATAYIIIEVINNLAFPLNLPAWFATLMLVILVIGLPIVIVLAWIFDFTHKGIEKTESLEESKSAEPITRPVKRKLRASYILNAILIIAVIVLAYPKIFKQNTLERLRSSGERISVAVMPFQNLTNDTTWDIWQDGMKDILITALSNSEELKVRQKETVDNLIEKNKITDYAAITPDFASLMSRKLEANVFISGSIKQAGSKIRFNTSIIDSKNEDVLKSFQIEGEAKEDNIFKFIDSLSILIKNYLEISKIGQNVPYEVRQLSSTKSPEAYRSFLFANKAFMKRDYPNALILLNRALNFDTAFTIAKLHLAIIYGNQGMYSEAKKWSLRSYSNSDRLPLWQKIWINWVHAIFFETPREEIIYLKQLQEIDDQCGSPYSNAGYCYITLQQYDKAIPELERVLRMYKKLDLKPSWIYDYTILGYAYHKTGQYRKESKLYKKAELDYPEDPDLFRSQAILCLTRGDTSKAKRYIEKYKSTQKDNFISQADISTNMASLFSEAGVLDKAEKYYREAHILEPNNPTRLNNLAWFLIDKDRNINTGLELIEKARELNLDEYYYADCKGYGYLKLGKYKEALQFLEKSYSLMPVYSHDTYIHFEAAKKTVASQKRTDR